MSLAIQEHVMLSLLFDKKLREAFCKNKKTALLNVGLDDEELNDFMDIDIHGLMFDASLRVDLILSQMAKQLPMTFTLFSSFDRGLLLLQELIDIDFILTPTHQRLSCVVGKIEMLFSRVSFISQADYSFCISLFHCEKNRLLSAEKIRRPDAMPSDRASGLIAGNIRLSHDVSIALLPLSFSTLENRLQCCDVQLWRKISADPFTQQQRLDLQLQRDPRLLLTKAVLSYSSIIEKIVEYKTIELPEGFASLMPYVNGDNNVEFILEQLKQAGADQPLIKVINQHFLQLIKEGYIELVR